MRKINFSNVRNLIENSVFVDSTDEVLVNADECSIRIISVGTIDENGLAHYLFNELGESFEVFEVESYEESINEWKEVNGIEEDEAVYYYDVQLQLDDDVVNDILHDEYDVKIYDDSWSYMAILEGKISEDEILDTLEEYSISRDRVSVHTNSLMFFEGTEVQIEVYS